MRGTYVGHDFVVTAIFQSRAQEASFVQVCQDHVAVTFETHVQEGEVLCDDGPGRSTEVEGK